MYSRKGEKRLGSYWESTHSSNWYHFVEFE